MLLLRIGTGMKLRELISPDNKWGQRARWFYRTARWEYRKRVTGFSVSDEPNFGAPEATNFFLERLALSRMYLEYGPGASTVAAARNKKHFITVDGDRFYLNAIQKKIERQFGSVSGMFLYANIGLNEEWSNPTIKHPTTRRLNQWKCYPETPWAIIEKKMEFPDLILIDGRFRVACALVSLKHLRKFDFILLIDDYAGRPHYRLVEDFAHLASMQGRMAVFEPKQIDPVKINAAIEAAYSDYR
jgi:hypothetical protein